MNDVSHREVTMRFLYGYVVRKNISQPGGVGSLLIEFEMNMKKWNQKCIKEIWWLNRLSQKLGLHTEITIYKKQEENLINRGNLPKWN